ARQRRLAYVAARQRRLAYVDARQGRLAYSMGNLAFSKTVILLSFPVNSSCIRSRDRWECLEDWLNRL
ncbi:MAG TPA: hypothetical protein PKJ23_09460, partial [bacterium]|nr:hypothetical protein [bacterium]